MNKSIFVFSLLLIACNSITNKKEAIAIQNKVELINGTKTDLGFNLQELEYIDTFSVKDFSNSLLEEYSLGKRSFSEFQGSVPTYHVDISGRIFHKVFLTKNKIKEIRDWEKKNRKRTWRESGDYYKFLFSPDCYSSWCKTLRTKIEETNALLDKYDSLEDMDLDLAKNVSWYYKRIDQFNTNGKSDKKWEDRIGLIDSLIIKREAINQIESYDPNKVVQYRVRAKYTILNPMLNNVKQEIVKEYMFNSARDSIIKPMSIWNILEEGSFVRDSQAKDEESKSVARLEPIVKEKPPLPTVEQLFSRAKKLYKEKDYQSALDDLLTIKENYPESKAASQVDKIISRIEEKLN